MNARASKHRDGGLPGPIAETFGTFEPRFYGVSVLLESPLAYQAFAATTAAIPRKTSIPTLSPFEDICLATALDHEVRHFHDSLVSPFANRILMLRMMAAFNGLKALNRGQRLGANCIPVPLIKWVATNEDQRSAWANEISQDLPPGLSLPLHLPPLPYLIPKPVPQLRNTTSWII